MIKNKEILIKKGKDESIVCDIVIKQDSKFSLKLYTKNLGKHEWFGIDVLDCFNQMRLYLEDLGFILLVNGTNKNTWASGSLRDSSFGILTYLLKEEYEHEILDIFDFCDINNVTLEVHKKSYKNWLKRNR